MTILFLLAVVIGVTPAGSAQGPVTRENSSRSHSPHPAADGAHQDHDPKHGGTFFMALDSHHHLEGLLERPGVFRVYLYDSHTRALPPGKMRQASGTVLVGDSDNAPEVRLQLSSDGRTLEAALDRGIKLPVTLTLLLRFPGMARDAKPELFTFPFREFSKTRSTQPVQQTMHVDRSR
jgi:hypothetical protein